MRISTTLYTRHRTVHTVQPRSTHSRHEANMKHIYTRYVAWNQPGSDFRWPNIESMIVMIGQTPIAWQNVEYNRLFLANSSLHEWWCLLFCYLKSGGRHPASWQHERKMQEPAEQCKETTVSELCSRVRQWWVSSLILLTAGFSCQLTYPPSMI